MLTPQEKAYVLVSACRNESAYIDGLIDAIGAQTVLPLSWVIIDDGSTDDTYARAAERGSNFSFLRVVQMPGGRPRSFSSQVYAALRGYDLIKTQQFSFIGFLDTDIRVDPDYYERLLLSFQADAKLGLCGGSVVDKYDDKIIDSRKGSEDYHVAGGVQFFRRECFEQVGGYVPISGGGQDTIADITALMYGWRIRVFPELKALHLRPDGFAKDSVYRRGVKWGRKFYLLGYHPIYYFGQCLRRLNQKPFVLCSVCQLFGFLLATTKGEPRPVSKQFVAFLRQLQMKRVWRHLTPRVLRPNDGISMD
jgi:biofilm PGA synthesis N-glycosyltransferase PgaC